MDKFIRAVSILSLLVVTHFTPNSYAEDTRKSMVLTVVDVQDGDTIRVLFKTLPTPLNQMSIRIRGINAPEMPAPAYRENGKLGKAKCMSEAENAIAAKTVLMGMLFDGKTYRKITVTDYEWDKYGGRVVANVSVGGKDVGSVMLSSGYAVPYDGTVAKSSWCGI